MEGLSEFEKACAEVDEEFSDAFATENVIEFTRNSKIATVTFCQGRYVSKLRKLAEEHPDEVEIKSDANGYVLAHIPVSYIKIRPPREVSEEFKKAASERLKNYRNQNKAD